MYNQGRHNVLVPADKLLHLQLQIPQIGHSIADQDPRGFLNRFEYEFWPFVRKIFGGALFFVELLRLITIIPSIVSVGSSS